MFVVIFNMYFKYFVEAQKLIMLYIYIYICIYIVPIIGPFGPTIRDMNPTSLLFLFSLIQVFLSAIEINNV
jgi:hypothetical protein